MTSYSSLAGVDDDLDFGHNSSHHMRQSEIVSEASLEVGNELLITDQAQVITGGIDPSSQGTIYQMVQTDQGLVATPVSLNVSRITVGRLYRTVGYMCRIVHCVTYMIFVLFINLLLILLSGDFYL